MKFEQYGLDMTRSEPVMVSIDFDTLHLRGNDVEGATVDEQCDSLAQLQAAYDERIAPAMADDRWMDVDRGDAATPVADLGALEAELLACGHDWEQEPVVADEPVEALVTALVTRIRRELNRALGAAEIALEHVVLVVTDGLIKPAVCNPPALAGKDGAELQSVVQSAPDWHHGVPLAFATAHDEALGEPLVSQWPEPDAFGPQSLLAVMLDLVAARIEANPRLRSNVSVPNGLHLLFVFAGDETIDFARRAQARALADQPAAAYFDLCRPPVSPT